MFSRILAAERRGGTEHPERPEARRDQLARGPSAPAGGASRSSSGCTSRRARRGSLKTSSWIASNSRPSASICSSESGRAGSRSRLASSSVSRSRSRCSLVFLLRVGVKVRSPPGPRERSRRCARSRPPRRGPHRCAGRAAGPSRACRRRCGRCPSGSRTAARAPASSPATRIGWLPSLSASASLLQELDRAALAPAGAVAADDRLEALHVQAAPRGPRPSSAARSRRASRRGRRGRSRARASRRRARRGRSGAIRPSPSRVCCSCRRSPSLRSASSRSRSPKITSPAVGAECRWTTSSSSSSRSSTRSIAMIGVIPLPAEMNRSRSGRGSGSTNWPSTSESEDDRARPQLAVDVRRHLALVDQLRRDRDEAVGTARVGGDRVGAPVALAVDVEADPQVLAGLVAGPGVPGADQDRGRVAGLAVELLDPAAELARRPQRVDQLEVVVGQQRRGEGADRAQGPRAQRMDVGFGASFSHRGAILRQK